MHEALLSDAEALLMFGKPPVENYSYSSNRHLLQGWFQEPWTTEGWLPILNPFLPMLHPSFLCSNRDQAKMLTQIWTGSDWCCPNLKSTLCILDFGHSQKTVSTGGKSRLRWLVEPLTHLWVNSSLTHLMLWLIKKSITGSPDFFSKGHAVFYFNFGKITIGCFPQPRAEEHFPN